MPPRSPAVDGLDKGVDVAVRPGEEDRPVGPDLVPSFPGGARLAAPLAVADGGVAGPPVHSARMTAIASSRRAARSFGSGKSMPYAACSFGPPPIPMPSTNRPPLAIWRVDAIRARTAG